VEAVTPEEQIGVVFPAELISGSPVKRACRRCGAEGEIVAVLSVRMYGRDMLKREEHVACVNCYDEWKKRLDGERARLLEAFWKEKPHAEATVVQEPGAPAPLPPPV
jgi:hypothetical protein